MIAFICFSVVNRNSETTFLSYSRSEIKNLSKLYFVSRSLIPTLKLRF